MLSWGTGRLWNPTDLLSPFAPTVVDKEVRRGIDAVRVSVPLGETTQLDALWLPQKVAAEMGGAVRLVTNVKDTDVSVSAAKYVREQTADIGSADAVISFLKDRADIYLLTVRKLGARHDDERWFEGRVLIMEPLSVSRARRMLAEAHLTRKPSLGAGVMYEASIPVHDAETDRLLSSYEGLLLLDKVLSLMAPADAEAPDEVPWEA